jgi:aminoglycoside 3-N-acetyltransferase I
LRRHSKASKVAGVSYDVVHLTESEAADLVELNRVFARAFEDPQTYQAQPPSLAYLSKTLARPDVIVLVARSGREIVGGLVAYVLHKLERERSEVYIYDLAVAEEHRRRGIATQLIDSLKPIAAQRGAWVIYVQADPWDAPAMALYTKLGTREDVHHFDIPVALAQP